jgi:hypothetical protein
MGFRRLILDFPDLWVGGVGVADLGVLDSMSVIPLMSDVCDFECVE